MYFYKTVLTVIEMIRDFAQRYSKLAKEKLADKETDANAKKNCTDEQDLCQGSI